MARIMEEQVRDMLRTEIAFLEENLVGTSLHLDSVLLRLELLYGYILRLNECGIAPDLLTHEVLEIFRCLFETLTKISNNITYSSEYQAITSSFGYPGRPRYDIPREQLVYFIENGFTCISVSKMLGISPSTIHRRMREYGLSIGQTYSQITNDELNVIVQQAHTAFPNAGYRFICGWLRQQGLKVQEHRIRQSLREIDPVGIAHRWLTSIRRRTYSVKGSQSLWHLDGNHKLIRWRFVIHGAIDGFSRVVVYLKCSNNNRAQTVLSLFQEAISMYGLPIRIRTDKGVENYDVAMYMLTHVRRGISMNPVIVGKSVHNQRIERLWRDVFQGVLCTYYYLFYHLEEIGLLDINLDVDMFCLHYVYDKVINSHLEEWVQSWNTHKISGCRGKSPMQLWIEGWQRRHGDNDFAQEMFQIDINEYGLDWDGPLTHESEEANEGITVPPINCPLTQREYLQLSETFPQDIENIISDGTFGIATFTRVRTFVNDILNEF